MLGELPVTKKNYWINSLSLTRNLLMKSLIIRNDIYILIN